MNEPKNDQSASYTPQRLFPNVPEDGYRGAHLALETLGLLNTFQQLGSTEIYRVIEFVEDARRRESDPAEARAYSIMETFGAFVTCYLSGDRLEEMARDMELTPDQYERYETAWGVVQAVFDETEGMGGHEATRQ